MATIIESTRFLTINIIATLLRFIPLPCKTGLIKIGNPDKNSPVFLTGNYLLTVERIKKSLRGIDCYVLIAKSKGVNVWCAAAGGLFTNHDVISILKTSGVEEQVDHRNVILPQLAASGIEAKVIRQKIDWNVIWGSVYAKDIPLFMAKHFQKSSRMRQVEFPVTQRIEIATAWAFSISITAILFLIFWGQELIIPICLLVWGLSFFIFLLYPTYYKWLNKSRTKKGFNFSQGGIQLILWGMTILCLVIGSLFLQEFQWEFILRWSLISLIIIVILTLDLLGNTPIFKSSTHEHRFFKICVDKEKCKGVGLCLQVCPQNCFQLDESLKMPNIDRCVKCGACVVQCPCNALYFKNSKGQKISPETIRKFKLNLMGKRSACSEFRL